MKRITAVITAYVTLLIFLACSGNPELQSEHPLETNLIPNVQVSSAPQTFSVEERIKEHNIPGFALGIIENNQLVFSKGYGLARKNETIPVGEASVFAAGSISKSITGLTALFLEKRGNLSLDKNIAEYLTDWQLPESHHLSEQPVTLRHLLNHTAGIIRFNSKGVSQGDTLPTLVEVLNGNRYSPGVIIDTIPGARYRYSNLGYGIVQKVIEDVTGNAFNDVAKELVLDPLKMTSSTFAVQPPIGLPGQYVHAHDDDGNVYDGYWMKPLILASGGLRSTISDLSKLLLALSNALSEKADSHIPNDIAEEIIASNGYNLGFEITGKDETLAITHTGRVPGFFAYMRIYPSTGKGLIMLCNSDNGGEIFKDVLRGASALYGWDIVKPRMIDVVNISPAELNKFVGSYILELGGDSYIAEILADGQHLKYKMKDEPEQYPLRHVGNNLFVDLIDGDDLQFVLKDGVATQLITNNEYTFNRILN